MLDVTALAAVLPSRASLSSRERGWRDVVVERYCYPPGTISIPGLREHLLILHRCGPLAIEQRCYGGQWGRRWTDRGLVSFIPAGTPVCCRFAGRPDVLLIHIATRLLDEVIEGSFERDPGSIRLVPCFANRDPVLDRLGMLLSAEAECEDAAGDDGLMAEVLARALAVQLLRSRSSLATNVPDFGADFIPVRLKRVTEFMREHQHRRISLKELAGLSGLSVSHFGRAFRASFGVSPHRYLLDLRIDRARELLQNTDMTVIEVALRCGFEQPTHFSTTFRSRVGVGPRSWRTQWKS